MLVECYDERGAEVYEIIIKQIFQDLVLGSSVDDLKAYVNPDDPVFVLAIKMKKTSSVVLFKDVANLIYDKENDITRILIDNENYLPNILKMLWRSFSRDEIYEIAIKLLDLAEILHNKNIVHRDIRLPNVIIRSNNELALIDFGLARYVDDKKYMKKEDYWYIGDFLIHLYYSSYESISNKEKPWYEELDLNEKELSLLRKLMGIDKEYESIQTIRNQLNELKELNKI